MVLDPNVVIRMWMALAIATLGLLQFLDTGLYTYLAYGLSVNGIYLGILSSLWSITYIISNYVFGKIADYGHNRALVALSCVAMLCILLLFNRLNELSGLVIYSSHALAIAIANLSISVTILEMTDYLSWNTVNSAVRSLSGIIRGIALLVVAFNVVSIFSMVTVTTATLTLLAILIPGIGINLERRLYSINKELSNISRYIKASAALLYLHRPRDAYEYFERIWGSGEISSSRVLLATILYMMFSDMVFTVLPLLIKPFISLESIFLSWGIVFTTASIASMLIISKLRGNIKLLSILTVLRGSCMVLLLPLATTTLTLIIYLMIAVLLGTSIDVLLYNVYVESSSGYGTSKYFISRELGSVIGSLIGGILIACMPSLLPITVLSIALASALILLL